MLFRSHDDDDVLSDGAFSEFVLYSTGHLTVDGEVALLSSDWIDRVHREQFIASDRTNNDAGTSLGSTKMDSIPAPRI